MKKCLPKGSNCWPGNGGGGHLQPLTLGVDIVHSRQKISNFEFIKIPDNYRFNELFKTIILSVLLHF